MAGRRGLCQSPDRFLVFVKPMNRLKAMTEKPAEPAGPPEPSPEEKLLAEIRDLLKNRG